LTPPQFTSRRDDYSPTGGERAHTWYLTTDAARNISGTSIGQTEGRQLRIVNDNTAAGRTISLLHEDANSAAANRFDLRNDVDAVIDPGGAVDIWYDDTLNRWRAVLP
jgi:hypothetical protein